jgi:hypothetical protein
MPASRHSCLPLSSALIPLVSRDKYCKASKRASDAADRQDSEAGPQVGGLRLCSRNRCPRDPCCRRFREVVTYRAKGASSLHNIVHFDASLEPAEIQQYCLLHLPNSTTVVLSVWWRLTSWRGKWDDFETAGPGLCGLPERCSMLPCLRSSCEETTSIQMAGNNAVVHPNRTMNFRLFGTTSELILP